MRVPVLPVLALLASPVAGQAHAQQCPPARADVPTDRPYFEFQVETPAAFVADTALPLRPIPVVLIDRKPDPAQDVVQFVVDTAGVPIARTFRVLRATPAASAAARATFERWRFRPALVGGCKVPQLVQTAIGR
jgi:hypothetical protein